MTVLLRVVAPVLLAGCGYSSIWPDYPDWLVDSGTAPEVQEPLIPCVSRGGQPLTLTFVSTSTAPLTLAVVDPPELGCGEVPYATLAPAEQLTVEVTDDLVWTVRDQGGALLTFFQVPPGMGTWTQAVP